MNEWIEAFIEQKELTENSKKAYHYDLTQFEESIDGQINDTKLKVYEQTLASLKPSAQKRKISAINQFLLYLYDEGLVNQYHRLKQNKTVIPKADVASLIDVSFLQNDTEHVAGQLIALLATYLGLVPSEMMILKWSDIDLDYAIITIRKNEGSRIMKIPKVVMNHLQPSPDEVFVFDNAGHSYSRQWFFNQLKAYLAEQGQAQLTTQDLREQYILHEKEKGVDLLTLSKQLGLKSHLTLLKYYN